MGDAGLPPGHIRPIAICVFRHGRRILVGDAYDPTKEQLFYRPVGGGIHFGEASVDAVRREVAEELRQPIEDVRLLGVIENLFTFDGAQGHEVVFVYDARFADATLYQRERLDGVESDGSPFNALWVDLDEDRAGLPPVYPDGLLELLRGVEG